MGFLVASKIVCGVWIGVICNVILMYVCKWIVVKLLATAISSQFEFFTRVLEVKQGDRYMTRDGIITSESHVFYVFSNKSIDFSCVSNRYPKQRDYATTTRWMATSQQPSIYVLGVEGHKKYIWATSQITSSFLRVSVWLNVIISTFQFCVAFFVSIIYEFSIRPAYKYTYLFIFIFSS